MSYNTPQLLERQQNYSERDKAFDNIIPPKPADEPWEEPISLPEGLPPVAQLEKDMLPSPLREFVWDIADRMQIPPDFTAASLLVVLSSLIGRRLGIWPSCA